MLTNQCDMSKLSKVITRQGAIQLHVCPYLYLWMCVLSLCMVSFGHITKTAVTPRGYKSEGQRVTEKTCC